MTADKAAKLIADEFHLDVFHDSLDDLKAKAAASASSSAGATSSSSAAASSSYTYATMPDKSKPTPVKSALTVDNPTPATVRLYFLDQDGQSHLKRILAPFQTVTDEAFEGTLMQKVKKEFLLKENYTGSIFYLSDDRTGNRLGWVLVLSRPTLIHAPDAVINSGDVDLLPPSYTD